MCNLLSCLGEEKVFPYFLKLWLHLYNIQVFRNCTGSYIPIEFLEYRYNKNTNSYQSGKYSLLFARLAFYTDRNY